MSTPANIAYLYAAILFAAGFVFVIIATTLANILAPHRSTKEKLQTYESGETPIGSAWVQYPLGFYIFALLFVAFDVDIVFIISWAVVFKQLSFFGFFEILFFIEDRRPVQCSLCRRGTRCEIRVLRHGPPWTGAEDPHNVITETEGVAGGA